MAYKVEYYCVSHTGKCRKINQDNFICNSEYLPYQNNGTRRIVHGEMKIKKASVFGIFDGMGGEECGEMAAYLAAKRVAEYKFQEENPEGELVACCREANADICQYTKEHDLTSMGTTAAMLLLNKKKIYLCNIGDSKVFHFSEGKLQQISYDHVSVAMFGKKPPLTQSLGIPEEELQISPYTASGEYESGDIYLICSDGLTDMVDTSEIASLLQFTSRRKISGELLKKALDNGGKDNVSFIILYIDKKKYFTFREE